MAFGRVARAGAGVGVGVPSTGLVSRGVGGTLVWAVSGSGVYAHARGPTLGPVGSGSLPGLGWTLVAGAWCRGVPRAENW